MAVLNLIKQEKLRLRRDYLGIRYLQMKRNGTSVMSEVKKLAARIRLESIRNLLISSIHINVSCEIRPFVIYLAENIMFKMHIKKNGKI